jgi:hypothetical protein
MVARDGIEPPTPAFSGLYSAEVKGPVSAFVISDQRRLRLVTVIGEKVDSIVEIGGIHDEFCLEGAAIYARAVGLVR